MIYNHKPLKEPLRVFEPDMKEIERMRKEFRDSLKLDEQGCVLDENFVEGEDYELVLSSASTPLDKIQGIIFGGLSSRFWMLRKHMNCYNVRQTMEGKTPFYAWQCISLQLKNREIDLVIPDDQDMDRLIMVIVQAINTVDGNRDSVNKCSKTLKYQKMVKQEVESFTCGKDCTKSHKFKDILENIDRPLDHQSGQAASSSPLNGKRANERRARDKRGKYHKIKPCEKLVQRLTHQRKRMLEQCKQTTLSDDDLVDIYRFAWFKFKIMRVRCKLSYLAFQKKQTVCEMLLTQILKTFQVVAQLKEEENGDSTDMVQIFRMNDHHF